MNQKQHKILRPLKSPSNASDLLFKRWYYIVAVILFISFSCTFYVYSFYSLFLCSYESSGNCTIFEKVRSYKDLGNNNLIL